MTPKRLAHVLSWGLHPLVLPLYLAAVLLTLTLFARYPMGVRLYMAWVAALYGTVIPLLGVAVLRSAGRISSYRIDDRRERLWPLAVGAVSYLFCAVTLARVPSAEFLQRFAVAAACCETMCFLVSLRWKISLHLTAMGAAVALLAVLNVVGAGRVFVPLVVSVLCAGALASARLYLGCHTPRQVAAGFFVGFVVTTLAMLFL